MHKFKFGDKLKVAQSKAVFIKNMPGKMGYIVWNRKDETCLVPLSWIKMDYAGTFTLRKARGGFRYNVVGLNGEAITTSEVLVAKQSATEMHERHYRNYKLVDKTVKG